MLKCRMAQIELELLDEPYEFEDRGLRFMKEVITLSRDFPDLLIEADNKSLKDLDANSSACKKSMEKKKTAVFEKVFARGMEKDINSSTEVTIEIYIHSNSRKRTDEFKRLVGVCAKQFGGKKTGEDNKFDPDAPADGFKYFTYQDFTFRG